MTLGHEKLDIYRLSIGYVTWVYEKAANLRGVHRPACDQWLRASQSIPLNIAEGNGKTAESDKRRYFEITPGSALECAAIQDVLVVGKALAETESQERKVELDRMAAMLSRIGGLLYTSHQARKTVSLAARIPARMERCINRFLGIRHLRRGLQRGIADQVRTAG